MSAVVMSGIGIVGIFYRPRAGCSERWDGSDWGFSSYISSTPTFCIFMGNEGSKTLSSEKNYSARTKNGLPFFVSSAKRESRQDLFSMRYSDFKRDSNQKWSVLSPSSFDLPDTQEKINSRVVLFPGDGILPSVRRKGPASNLSEAKAICIFSGERTYNRRRSDGTLS
jgi:hypothetical protein